MYRVMLKSKIHRAKVTEANINYSGSITIDRDLLEAANIYEHERVQVVNVTNGARLETYTIAGSPASGEIIINGAAARRIHQGDVIIIISYAIVEESAAKDYESIVVTVDDQNKTTLVSKYQAAADLC